MTTRYHRRPRIHQDGRRHWHRRHHPFRAGQAGRSRHVEQPKVGRKLAAKEDAAIIESVKAAAEVKSPVDGEVIEVNEAVVADPSLVNTDPEGAGWFFKIKVSNADAVASCTTKPPTRQ